MTDADTRPRQQKKRGSFLVCAESGKEQRRGSRTGGRRRRRRSRFRDPDERRGAMTATQHAGRHRRERWNRGVVQAAFGDGFARGRHRPPGPLLSSLVMPTLHISVLDDELRPQRLLQLGEQ